MSKDIVEDNISNITLEKHDNNISELILPIKKNRLYLVDHRKIVRDCFEKCLKKIFFNYDVFSFGNMSDLYQSKIAINMDDVVLIYCDPKEITKNELVYDNLISKFNSKAKYVLLCDSDELKDVIDSLDKGARGYIYTDVGLNVAIEAIRLIQAGGVFVPSSCLFQQCAPGDYIAPRSRFTPRQTAVLEQLQTGKSNKIIAFELTMKESTVKVHIRNIMRILGATNRTQVVVEMYSRDK